MSRKKRDRGTTVFLDEHLDPEIKDVLVDVGYRPIRIQESPYRGRDERDFISKLRSDAAVFATSDIEFVDEAIGGRIAHGGIWCVNPALSRDERVLLAAINAGFFLGVPARHMRGVVSYLAHDGLHLVIDGDDDLAYSFPAMAEDFGWRPESS
jgi:hypothetical protein